VTTQVQTLRRALEGLATALAGRDAGAVLAHEGVLHELVAMSTTSSRAATAADPALAADLAAARAALARCRALGAAHADMTRVTLDVLGRGVGYSRHGAGAPRSPRGRDLHARV